MAEAEHCQVINSHQKDETYRNHLKSLMLDFINSISKKKSWLKHIETVSMMADVIYFASTTISGNQTMGEEANNILLVNKDKKSLPQKFRSAIMVVFHVILPHTINKSTTYLTTLTLNHQTISDDKRKNMLNMIKIFSGFLLFLQKFNSILFYVSGAYYHISKRLNGLLYLQSRPQKFNSIYKKTYPLLGWLMLLQSLIASSTYAYNTWKNSNNNINLFLYNLLGLNLLVSSPYDHSNTPEFSTFIGLTSYLLNNVQKSQQDASAHHTQRNETSATSSLNEYSNQPSTTRNPSSSTPLNNNPTNSTFHNKTQGHTNTHTTKSDLGSKVERDDVKSLYKSLYKKSVVQNAVPQVRLCSLCCEKIESPTATMCGHVFCYYCITQWCLTKTECPMCKKEVVLSRLVFMKNFA